MRKILIAVAATAAVGAAVLETSSAAQAHWVRGRPYPGSAYAGISHAGWGLGGVAAGALVGGV